MANTKITSRVLADNAVLTANITDANVTTAKIAADAITGAKIADDVALGGNPTTTTQSAGNNTTRVATTAFVSTAVSNLVDSSPSALNTLNELAAALGDDANFSTTVTNSIAAKLPLAGGTMTGNIVMGDDTSIGIADDAERIEFDGAGDINILGANLGIGESSPAALLHIKGATATNEACHILFENTSGTKKFAVGGGTSGVTNNNFVVRNVTDSTFPLVITDAGNVGIGTTSPDKKLEVAGTDVVAKFTGTDANPPQIEFENSTGVQATIGLKSGHDFIIDTAGEDVHIGPNASSAGTNGLMVAAAGRVGIGTTSPDGILHVKPASGDTYVILEAGQSDGNTGLIYHNNSGTQVGYNLYDTDDNIYYLGVGGINRLKVQSGSHFELRGPDANSNQVKMMDSSGNIDGYLYAEAGEIGFLDADGNWAFQVNTDTSLQGKINNSEAFLFKIAAGNHNNHEIMSIGGVTPRNDITLTQQAHGENWGSGGHTTNGYFYVINSSNSGVYIVNGQNSWTGNSDERIKENITSLGTVLPEIANIRCVKFNLKGDTETRIGFIAQDWESKSFSEVLNLNDGFVVEEDGSVKPATESDSTEKVKGIAYTETIPVLLKAIQELTTKLEAAEARIEALES